MATATRVTRDTHRVTSANLSRESLELLDRLVALGVFSSRSAAIEYGISLVLAVYSAKLAEERVA